jgi:hypothetical protein
LQETVAAAADAPQATQAVESAAAHTQTDAAAADPVQAVAHVPGSPAAAKATPHSSIPSSPLKHSSLLATKTLRFEVQPAAEYLQHNPQQQHDGLIDYNGHDQEQLIGEQEAAAAQQQYYYNQVRWILREFDTATAYVNLAGMLFNWVLDAALNKCCACIGWCFDNRYCWLGAIAATEAALCSNPAAPRLQPHHPRGLAACRTPASCAVWVREQTQRGWRTTTWRTGTLASSSCWQHHAAAAWHGRGTHQRSARQWGCTFTAQRLQVLHCTQHSSRTQGRCVSHIGSILCLPQCAGARPQSTACRCCFSCCK